MNVPGIRMVDAVNGLLGIEWIEGKSVRFLLGGGAEGEAEADGDDDDGEEEGAAPADAAPDLLEEYTISHGTSPPKISMPPAVHADRRRVGCQIR